jgi:transcriptional regulator with XRE-family HTH domain
VWKLIRESVGLTQLRLAEDLNVDVATIQGWESGRRALTAVRSGDLARLRVRLIRRGAPPKLFSVLSDAIEADAVIEHALRLGPHVGDPDHHPLAATVHRRDLTNLITWPLNEILPTQLRGLVSASKRRGPTPSRPSLAAAERRRFFEHVLGVANRHQNGEALLRRQAVYLLSFDTDRHTKDWLVAEYARCMRNVGRSADAMRWIAVRSAAVGLTRHGLKDPLYAFMASGLRDHQQEIANLNYWAYWLGEVHEIHVDDSFMQTTRPSSWDGARLLGHLAERIAPGSDQLELNVHTMWQLLLARPHLLTEQPDLRELASARVEETLDRDDLSRQARQELSDVAYAVRLARR